ncbi:uncharacterized protein [Coffea arabica]|uniref:Uncharacterized protein isoform X2 n=1 Tax=Coffea arabica TaxID=13443 RepID=A0A6P6TWP9_COFAR|nr:uncharacterized protein LOC113705082 isoform X2 [Coffea arabica]
MGTPGTSPLCRKMGNKLTILENRTWFNIEIKMWVDVSRPDRFKKIVRIEPGRSIRVKASTFNSDDQGSVEHALLLVCANGSWTGKYILPQDLFAWAAVFCDSNRHGQVILQTQVKDVLFEPVRKTQDAMFFINTPNGMWMPCGPKQSGAVQITMPVKDLLLRMLTESISD